MGTKSSMLLLSFSLLCSYSFLLLDIPRPLRTCWLAAPIPRERELGLLVCVCVAASAVRVSEWSPNRPPIAGLYITNRFIIAEQLVRIGKWDKEALSLKANQPRPCRARRRKKKIAAGPASFGTTTWYIPPTTTTTSTLFLLLTNERNA